LRLNVWPSGLPSSSVKRRFGRAGSSIWAPCQGIWARCAGTGRCARTRPTARGCCLCLAVAGGGRARASTRLEKSSRGAAGRSHDRRHREWEGTLCGPAACGCSRRWSVVSPVRRPLLVISTAHGAAAG
jgi:hypothetical protein